MVNENEVITIKLDDIIPNRFQPREMFDEESLKELADSIKEHGVIQPIIVRPVDNKYEIIVGERRYKASVMAGKTDIPALVRDKDDKESSIMAYIENSQRKNMSPIEEAKTCERLLSTNDLTQEQLAKQLGMSQSTLANKLRLLTLPVEIQNSLLHGEISERHARSLLSIKETKTQLELLDKIKNEKLTVRELDGVIKNMLEEPNKDGLYNLPGIEETKVEENKEPVMDFSSYMNPVENEVKEATNTINEVVETAKETVQEATQEKPNEFLTFLNNFDDSKIVEATKEPEAVPEATVEVPAVEVPKEESTLKEEEKPNEFLTFLNNFDDSKIKEATKVPETQEKPVEAAVAEPVVAPVQEEKPQERNNEFMDFLNKFDDSKIAEANKAQEPVPETPVVPTPVVEEPKVETPAQPVDQNFDNFLKDFNAGITPVPPEIPEDDGDNGTEGGTAVTPVTEQKEETKEDNDFIKFLNDYDAKTVVPTPVEEIEVKPTNEEFMKKYELPSETPVDLGPVETLQENEPVVDTPTVPDDNSKYLNPIEEVAPKTEYVENSPNYVDITKPTSFDSVDSIISELKVVTDKVKKSKYKITTEETNYDDIYTITIKIDKRNFL